MKRILPFLPAAGAGLLLGCLLPLNKSQPPAALAPGSQTSSHAPAVTFEMPADNHAAWAMSFGANHAQEFYQWLLKQNPQPDHEMVCAFFHAWLQSDPDAAFTAALRLPARFGFAPLTEKSAFDAEADGGFFIQEIWDMMKTNPGASFRWIGRVEGVLGAFGTMNFVTPFEDHPELKPEDVAKYLNQSLPGQFAGKMAHSYASYLQEKEGLDASLAWMRTLNPEYQNETLEAVCRDWGKTDPEGVMKYLQDASSPIRQYRALYLLTTAPGESTAKSIDWLDQNMGVTSFTGLCNLLAKFDGSDPGGAQQYVMGLDDPAQRLDAIAGLAESHTMRSKVPETMQWIATLPPDMQVQATAGAMRWRGESNYVDFLAPLSNGSLAPEIQEQYVQQLVTYLPRTLASGRGDALSQWLDANPGEATDSFARAGAAALDGKPEDRARFLSCLPTAEVTRVLGPQ